MKDYYKILGVQENATDEEIKKAYRRLSKEFHPDVNPQGAEKFKEIAEAYENIGTEEKRQQLKMKSQNPFGGHNPFGGQNFEEFFANMFGGGGGRPRRPMVPDKVVSINIDPIQSYLGDSYTINYFRNVMCNTCTGAGGNRKICDACKGVGYHSMISGSGYFKQEVRKVCNECNGDGYKLLSRCHVCDSRGHKPTAETIKIQLPVGIDDGQFLKLQGLGDYHDGIYGNLVIQIRMTPRDGWEKIGNDLIYNSYLSLEDLSQDHLLIKHPKSDLRVDIPNDFDSSKPLRLKGKGYGAGDMYVKLHVKFDRSKLKQPQ